MPFSNTRRMKILVVGSYYPEHAGGIELVAHNLVKRFRTAGHTVRWIACEVWNSRHIGDEGDLPLRAWNFTESKLGFPYPIPYPLDLLSTVQHVRWCDVVHLHDCLYLPNQFTYWTAKKLKKPVVTTQQVGFVPYRQGYKNFLQQAGYQSIGRLVLQGSAQVVFVNEVVKSWYEKLLKFSRPPLVAPNGVDTSIFHPLPPSQTQAVRSALGLPTDQPMLLFAGRFTEKKGLRLIYEVAREMPNWSWVLVGGVVEENPRTWSLPNVTVLPYSSQTELCSLYAAADLVVLPSVGEGFPLVISEAMACGTPIVVCPETAQAFHGLSDLVLITQPEAGSLKQTIKQALANPEAVQLLRPRLIAFAQKVLSWEAIAAKHCNIFASLRGS